MGSLCGRRGRWKLGGGGEGGGALPGGAGFVMGRNFPRRQSAVEHVDLVDPPREEATTALTPADAEVVLGGRCVAYRPATCVAVDGHTVSVGRDQAVIVGYRYVRPGVEGRDVTEIGRAHV